MTATSQQAINAYTRMDVDMAAMVASPHKLVLMLFEAAVKSVAKARMAMQKNQIKVKCDAIDRAIAIIQDGLQLSLDKKSGGEIAQNLDTLYGYMCIQLALANANNDMTKLDEVGRMLLDFKKSWEQIDPSAQQPNSVQSAAPVTKLTANSNLQKPAPVAAKVPARPVAKAPVQPVVKAAAVATQLAKPAEAKQQAESAPVAAQNVNDASSMAQAAKANKLLKGYASVPDSAHSFKA